MNEAIFLVQNGLVNVPQPSGEGSKATFQQIATIYSNFAFFGYIPSKDVAEKMKQLNSAELAAFWRETEGALSAYTGDDRDMDQHVVYKNFPREVLGMTESQYWFNQVLMYWGMPNEYFTQKPVEREKLDELSRLTVIYAADETSVPVIWDKLRKTAAKWNDDQRDQAKYIAANVATGDVVISDFGFKENAIVFAAEVFPDIASGEKKFDVRAATDVLRLAAALSGSDDISLRKPSKFRKFKRSERRFLVNVLETCPNLAEDFAARAEQWKRLLSILHPGEFSCPNVKSAYHLLYSRLAKTFDGQVEKLIEGRDISVLELLKSRPGVFMRRLHQVYGVFGEAAFEAFGEVLDDLSSSQLLKIDRYLKTVNGRKSMLVTPRGDWSKAKIIENTKVKISDDSLRSLRLSISEEINGRLAVLFPSGVSVDPDTDNVKIQANGQDLASYGRGTVFDIPENVTFLRTASYWKIKNFYSTWFDNGWNFFNDKWEAVESISWDNIAPFENSAALFSGDPTNSKELEGKACQMIDLYLDRLSENGVRYAVWNILCYSGISFAKADDVLATLQWGEKPMSGSLYEPSRAQMVFPLKGDVMAKYVAFIDIRERKLVYMDVGLRANVSSAKRNEERVGQMMPAFLEHIDAVPSIADLFSHANDGDIPVLSCDEGVDVSGEAYVFRPTNPGNSFEPINVESILSSKRPEPTSGTPPFEAVRVP